MYRRSRVDNISQHALDHVRMPMRYYSDCLFCCSCSRFDLGQVEEFK